MHRLHPREFGTRRRTVRARLFDADDANNGTAGAQLYMRANAYVSRRGDALSIYEGAKPGTGIVDRAATVGESELGVLARYHRPLLLGKEVMADGRITTDQDDLVRERALAMQLTTAILCENQFHR